MSRHRNNYEAKSKVHGKNYKITTKIAQVSQKVKNLASESRFSILVVDDELDAAKVLGKILKKRGYRIQLAANGLEALKKLQRNHFELVITDILMPKLDGIQLVKQIREQWPTLPVIVMTAVDDEQIYSQMLAMGAHAYLLKPFEFRQLLDAVAEVIQPFARNNAAQTTGGAEGLMSLDFSGEPTPGKKSCPETGMLTEVM
jgi:two-component system response regulator (stage 0 sporulation protein F)